MWQAFSVNYLRHKSQKLEEFHSNTQPVCQHGFQLVVFNLA